ncbi:MAG: FkbM family methyltransferase [Pyrinomonadaceae bacterium]|nr:FkbM family methyltransferase [Pyrinomonadaceae bacterium]MCX7640240.1 FkbM family methyltransferase [Pyrinomonadaceae bacterium]MDW8305136.1 FkbM family methyltransferase [Acidobacteriota bacterium]
MNKILYCWQNLKWHVKYYLPEHEVKLETKNGVLSFSSKDWLIGKQLFIHRSYEIEFIDSVTEFLKDNNLLYGDAICDVGANVGMIAIAFLRRGIFSKALAFEPFPKSFEFLVKNVKQNSLEGKILCFQVALSSEDGVAEFEISEENSGDNRVRKIGFPGEMKEEKRMVISVQKRSFDSIVISQEISPDDIGLVWLDIQGHEGYFFEGAKKFFQRKRVPTVCEFWAYGIRRSGMTSDRFCRTLQSLFQRFWLFDEGKFVEYRIDYIKNLFERFSDRRQVAQVILF